MIFIRFIKIKLSQIDENSKLRFKAERLFLTKLIRKTSNLDIGYAKYPKTRRLICSIYSITLQNKNNTTAFDMINKSNKH